MYTIIGSGFGIYGYLPAIVTGFGGAVVLPHAYEAKLLARAELSNTLTNIHWVKDEDAALSQASIVIVAIAPKNQYEMVMRCLNLKNIKELILEKPIAATPAMASSLVAKINEEKKKYRIGFTFLYLSWTKKLEISKSMVSDTELSITWTFMANHFYKHLATWKRSNIQGGGVLRFYGIHLVALLASQGYDGVIESKIEGDHPDEPFKWQAVFIGPELPKCRVFVDSFSTLKQFEISQNQAGQKRTILSVTDPFEMEQSDQYVDSRVGSLIKLINTLKDDDDKYIKLYIGSINLWQKIESISLEDGSVKL